MIRIPPDILDDPTQFRSHNAANETGTITTNWGTGWVTPAYDADGNMTDMPISGDESTKQTAVYDAWNPGQSQTRRFYVTIRDVTVRERRTSSKNRMLAAKRFLTVASRMAGAVDNESWQVLEERQGGSTNPYAQYVCGGGDARTIDAPVVRFRDADGTLDDTLYYATDANMNVTALLTPPTQPPATWARRLAVRVYNGHAQRGPLARRAWQPWLVGRGWAYHPTRPRKDVEIK